MVLPKPPKSLTRRHFLGSTLGLLAAPRRVSAAAGPRILDGVASGDVTHDSAMIWSRADRAARMIVDTATTESFTDAERVVGGRAEAATGFTAQTAITGLPPGRTIFYRVMFEHPAAPGLARSPVVGRLRTAPDRPGDVSFAFGGDQCGAGWGIDSSRGGLRMFETLRRANPDILLHLGDRIYADSPLVERVPLKDGTAWRNLVTPAKSKVAETLEEYRGNYAYNFLDEHYRTFAAETAQLHIWDDHEVRNDWWPERIWDQRRGHDVTSADVLAPRGRQAFLDYTPMRRHPTDPGRLYRSVPYGPMMEVFLLDGRSYRSPNSRNRQPKASPDSAMLGKQQVAWLKDALARSTALWKVIACDVPLGIAGGKRKKRYDKWSNRDNGGPLGRELELAGILSFIKAEKIRNTLWLVADVHYAAAHHFHPERAVFTDFDPFWQFIAGPFHTRARRPHRLDLTFGPEQVFASTPKNLRGNYAPSAGFLFFGMGHIDGATGTLKVSLRNVAGETLYEVDLPAAG